MGSIQSTTVVFITGAFVGNNCWDEWQTYFQSRGYATSAPAWPYKDAPVTELRVRHPHEDKELALLTLKELIDHYVSIIEALPEKPIVIGHSYGGLLTQLMVNRNITAN